MKNFVPSVIFRALCALVAGGLLVAYNEDTLQWMIILVGVIFFVSGVMSCIIYFTLNQNAEKILADSPEKETTVLKPSVVMPIVGVASIILGVMLAVIPNNFHEWFIYILSALLIVGAVGQLCTLFITRKSLTVGWGFWIEPFVIIIAASIVIWRHDDFHCSELIIGLSMLIYGITEIVNAIAIQRLRRLYPHSSPDKDSNIEDAEIVD